MKIFNQKLELGLLLAVLMIVSSCQPGIGKTGSEVQEGTGLYVFTGGKTSNVRLFRKASKHMGNQEFGEAEGIYRELIAKEPDNPDAYIGLGSSLIMQDRLPEAQAAYVEALNISPDSIEALVGLGSVHAKKGDYSIASDYYSQALGSDESNPNAHWGMALSLKGLGSGNEAIKHLERVIELAPNSGLAIDAEKMIAEIRE